MNTRPLSFPILAILTAAFLCVACDDSDNSDNDTGQVCLEFAMNPDGTMQVDENGDPICLQFAEVNLNDLDSVDDAEANDEFDTPEDQTLSL